MTLLTCPFCNRAVWPDQDTARLNGILCHASCAEDWEMARYEEATSPR